MQGVSPYLNFPGNTEEAFEFYKSIFGGEFTNVTRFRDFPENPMGIPDQHLDKIANIGLPLTDSSVLMGTDALESWGPLTVGNNVYITIEADSEEEAGRLFDALSAGGNIQMPLQQTQWAEKYGSLVDRFGAQWMVNYTGSVQFPG